MPFDLQGKVGVAFDGSAVLIGDDGFIEFLQAEIAIGNGIPAVGGSVVGFGFLQQRVKSATAFSSPPISLGRYIVAKISLLHVGIGHVGIQPDGFGVIVQCGHVLMVLLMLVGAAVILERG